MILPEELNIRNIGTVMFTGGETATKTKVIVFEPKTEHFGRSIVIQFFAASEDGLTFLKMQSILMNDAIIYDNNHNLREPSSQSENSEIIK